jgi:hypothetical protein
MIPDNEGLFEDCAVVACGTLSLELNHLRQSGFLNAKKILYTKPGRHEDPKELERLLIQQIENAKSFAKKVIVIYGGKFCYINQGDPQKTIDAIIKEHGPGVARVDATHCVDMLADADERDEMCGGKKVFWLTPGWIRSRNLVFQDWDSGKANETFPQNSGGAILLDAVGFWESYSRTHPERLLDFSDWMGIPIIPHPVSLTRFKNLICDCSRVLNTADPSASR